MDDCERLARRVEEAETVVALTGAGISAPSGVPTFRGDDGVWEQFDEGQFTYGRFQSDPAGFWTDRLELHRTMFDEEYEPNAGHEALAGLGRAGYLDAILTQNTDGLHGAATDDAASWGTDRTGDATAEPSGSDTEATVLELHGNARRVRCEQCGRRQVAAPIFDRVADGDRPPTCDCGGLYRPDVVLFGETLPGAVIHRARSLAQQSDVFLAIGSSLVVEPAASLPRLAAASGATVAIVTLEPTPYDRIADENYREDVTELLPRLRDAVCRVE